MSENCPNAAKSIAETPKIRCVGQHLPKKSAARAEQLEPYLVYNYTSTASEVEL